MRLYWRYPVQLLLLVMLVMMERRVVVLAEFQIAGLSEECYVKPGDVLLGLVLRQTQPADESPGECAPISRGTYYMQRLEAVVYGVQRVNNDTNLLPNITLGFVIFDTCSVYRMNIGQTTHFLPTDDMVSPRDVTPCEIGDQHKHYDVTAMLGMGSSFHTLPVALAASTYEIPIIGTMETSDELSDKVRFPYYVPIALPDKYQTHAMLQLLAHYNWTYFTLIYSEGSYGESAAKEIQKSAGDYDLCVENTYLIYQDSDPRHLTNLYDSLQFYTKARAILLFVDTDPFKEFLDHLPDELHGRFIWIGSDGTGTKTFGRPAQGLLSMNLKYGESVDFAAYYRSLTPTNNAANPWWNLLWENLYDCQWLGDDSADQGDSDGVVDCRQYENSTIPEDSLVYGWSGLWVDGVALAAHGLDLLIRRKCPEAFSDPSLLATCLTSAEYLSTITNVSFQGVSGLIEFDEKGEIGSGYVIQQYSSSEDRSLTVGYWSNTEGLQMLEHLVNWSLYGGSGGSGGDDPGIPDSVCSYPCGLKQYIIHKEVSCCWECRDCRDNEIIVANQTACEVCAENSWPDEETATLCLPIPPVYLKWTDQIGITLTFVSAMGVAATLVTAGLLVKHRSDKLIKASSKELMTVIITGILLAFLSALVVLAKPADATCFMRDLGFSVSVSIIYAPLLVKTIRVYRIFTAGKKGNKTLHLISARSQVAITTVLILLQIILTIIVGILKPSTPLTRMPVLTENYAELLCTLPPEVLTALLAYNLLLLLTCAVFGFLSRKLPENFNESWFIFVSLATTSFIWVVFLPTYFTTFYAYHKTALLATCLVLNGFITLLCLFVPKLYAVNYVDEGQMKFVTNTNTVTTVA